MDKPLFDQIVAFIQPEMNAPDDRKALIENALFKSAVLGRINWHGAAYTFTVALVRTLEEFGQVEPGKPALVALLEGVRAQVGADRQTQADALIKQVKASVTAISTATATITPPDKKLEGDLYVFISYARPQADIAEKIETYLKAAGVRVFRDTSEIRKGANWDMIIDTALRETNRMVLLLSNVSMPYRKEVHREWFYYDQENKPIYPLYVEKCTLHSRMYAYNYIDVTALGLQKALELLLTELGLPFKPPAGEPDRIIVDDSAETRTRPLAEILKAVQDPKGSIALSKTQIKELVESHKPRDLTEYRLIRIAEWSQPRYQLDNRFVNLTLLIDQGEDAQGARWAAPESRQFNDLREVLKARPDDPVLVLLGAPGSGKSTLLRRLQLDNAIDALRGNSDAVMFFVPLNAYRADSGKPRDWLNTEWARRSPELPKLNALLDSGKVVLLLDALNEMPHKTTADYHERVGLWREFIQEIVEKGNRALFSCRSLDYSASLSSKELRVPQIVVQPMIDDQIQAFLKAYLPARADTVWKELDGTVQREIFRTPYFLKLLCDQVEVNDGKPPKGRAGLFTGFVRQALEREISSGNTLFSPDGLLTDKDHQKLSLKKWRTPYELPDRGLLMDSLSQLAYTMQEKGLETDGAQVRIDYDDACEVIHNDRSDDILKAGSALNVLDEDLTEFEVLFFHQLLQEFFAARKLAENPDPGLVRVEWEVSKVKPTLAETIATLADSDPLPLLPQTGWEETTLLASVMTKTPEAFIRDLIPVNLPLAARAAAMPELTVSPALKRDIQDALIARTQDMNADLRARIAAGLALGTLGDPRFERRTGPHGAYLLPPLSKPIPAGEYPIGDDESDYDSEKPPHTVKLDSFQMGVFPVTNTEYGLFIAAGGYEQEQWWDTDAARAWLKGEGSIEGQKQSTRDSWNTLQSMSENQIRDLVPSQLTSEQADSFLWIKGLSAESLEETLNEWYPSGKVYREPEYWNDNTYNSPSQPVVGICWHEARAYCAWLSAQTGLTYQLPTEAEVEAAARGKEGRKYAYGPEFDSARSNTFESHIRRTTPIGSFDNATPEGVFDLSGNVYTWTSSAYEPYPYRAEDGREDPNRPDVRRALRGGSWNGSAGVARAAFRYNLDPVSRYVVNGFRVVLVVGRPPSNH